MKNTATKPKFLGIIFVRLDSNRLPKKALIEINRKPILEYLIIRAKKIINLDNIVLATTSRAIDDDLILLAQKNGIHWFRGDYENLAKRAVECADKFKSDYIVRLNGDSPFIDFDLINMGIAETRKCLPDLTTNIQIRSFPYGITCEIIKKDILRNFLTKLSLYEREHFTSYFYNNHTEFKIININSIVEYDTQKRFVIDSMEDLKIAQKVIKYLDQDFGDSSFQKIYEAYIKANL